MTNDLAAIESKWQTRWADAHAYEPKVEPGRDKFLGTYPYSYMNAFPHVGHAFTMLRVDLMARYQRMLGKNALYPFAFHVTGTPIVAAANRVRDGDAQQIKILQDQGIPESEIPAFKDPVHWVRYFPPKWREDVNRLGLGLDWRREFITTDLNPHYDAFIQWQFRKLFASGRVAKGRHPVIWCPKDKAPVADHDRYSGEGETPQEWVLYKMELADAPAGLSGRAFLLAATLRPDTVFGQTNVWVDPAASYRVLKRGDERWILNEQSANDLRYQFEDAELLADFRIPGKELVGQSVRAPGTSAPVPVLGAAFIRHEKGTGIVTSVPSDSPQDLLSLREAQAQGQAQAQGIVPIPVIRTQKYGTESAEKAIAEVGAAHHKDSEKIAAATEKAYQAGFYEGVLLDNAGQFAGMRVAQAKDKIKAWLVERDEAMVAYWPSAPVVCRCLTPSVVKVVSDQWFIRYGDEDWKREAHKAMESMTFYPPGVRKQFDYVVDWLRDWACTREHGLGTHLPMDPRWLIESLSDSTIYNAYYTIAHHLEKASPSGGPARKGVDAEDLSDAFFDFVFLDRGSAASAAKGTLTEALVAECRREFEYWYPLDFRNSGKDLVQNHLTFLVFNHTAIWPDQPQFWPKGVSVNGWVMVDGEKMSKSRGNFITLRQALDAYGASATRFALAFAGEGVDDANFDRDVAAKAVRQLSSWMENADNLDAAAVRTDEMRSVDRWMMATMDRLVAETRQNMEEANFRSALKTGFHDLQREWSWYQRRCAHSLHETVRDRFLHVQNALLTPFVPAIAEEVHEKHGWKGLAIDAPFPEPTGIADPALAQSEDLVRTLLDDVRNILKVTKMTPKRIVLTTAPEWKRKFHALAIAMAREKKLAIPDMMKAAMADPDIRAKGGKDAPKMAQDALKAYANLGPAELAARAIPLDETGILRESIPFLEAEFGANVVVQNADDAALDDPAGKARFAQPRKPAVYIE